MLVLWVIGTRRAWRLDLTEAILAGLVTIAFVKIAGVAFFHARPFVAGARSPLVSHAADNSFPSDHLAACGLAIGYLWTRNRTFAVVAGCCAVLIGAARVLAGLHWPVDVIAGALLGIAAVAIVRVTALRFWSFPRMPEPEKWTDV
ncbi:MAG TPA: phosphatase PAP2 family protein [Candidatus Rubrimentiphilum sp.]|nr:phosphatase PAP2 family protein [Candidatus Rubrimentiphilum sp.]